MQRQGATIRRPRRIVVACAALLTVFGTAARCSDGAAKNADASLKQLAKVPALTVIPTTGQKVGQGTDRGSNSTVTGREPGLTSVFTTQMTPAQAVTFYQRTFPKYHLVDDYCCPSVTHREISGTDGFADVQVLITTGKAKLPAHFDIKLAHATGEVTYVVVYVSGQQR